MCFNQWKQIEANGEFTNVVVANNEEKGILDIVRSESYDGTKDIFSQMLYI